MKTKIKSQYLVKWGHSHQQMTGTKTEALQIAADLLKYYTHVSIEKV